MSSIENECNVKCGACKCWRTENDFVSKNRKMKSCIICRERSKKYNIENADKRKQYNIKNADKIKDKIKQYYIENKEEILEYQKQHYQENKEKILNQKKEYNNKNKENKSQYDKNYYVENKTENPLHMKFIHMINSSKEKDKKYNRTYNADDFMNEDYLNELWINQNGKCFYDCCKVELSLEFNKDCRNPNQISVQRLKNDIAHIKENCVLSCLFCNQSHKEDADFYKKMVEKQKQKQ
tara:strand:+ start:68 stop:781 length:714 start_codon:yes stop_codon:yes gene_type:complete